MTIFLAIIVLLIVLMIIRIPVPFALGAASMAGYWLLVAGASGKAFSIGLVAQRLVSGLDSFILLAIPLFIFAGKLMNEGGITERLFDFSLRIVGRLRGGLGHVNVLGSLIFSGMSGAAVADVAGLGAMEIKAMRSAGYDGGFSAAVTGASSIIGPIVPPSIPMVVYAALAGVSTGKMFLGGIIPGLLMTVVLMIIVAIISHRRGYPVGERYSLADKFRAFVRALPPLLTPAIIIGGIWTGFFTPTEAACVASLYGIGLTLLVYRSIGIKQVVEVFRSSMLDSVSLLLILGVSTFYDTILSMLRIPYTLGGLLAGFAASPMLLVILLNLFIFVLGFFMPAMVIINIFTPIVVPVLTKMGVDPIFFGVVMVLNTMIGMLTPPYGIVLFTLSKVSDVPLRDVIREMWPFIFALAVVVALLLAFPPLVTFIPSMLK